MTAELRSKSFLLLLKQRRILAPMREFRFAPPRMFRFDFCWPEHKLALEVEGGVWTAGRHTRGSGFLADVEKYNLAVLHGWRLLRVTPDTLCTSETIGMLREAIQDTGGKEPTP